MFRVSIRASDGTHTRRYRSLQGALKQAELQLGRTVQTQYDGDYGWREGTHLPVVEQLARPGASLSFVCDYGRRITITNTTEG